MTKQSIRTRENDLMVKRLRETDITSDFYLKQVKYSTLISPIPATPPSPTAMKTQRVFRGHENAV